MKHQQGISLIELLVAVLIFSFGLLGIVGLQNRTLGYSQVSLYRSQATALTDDILDRMRADRINAQTGGWAIDSRPAAEVTGDSLAMKDIKQWKQTVESLLPHGTAAITNDGTRVTVTLEWSERTAPNARFVTVTRL